MILLVLAVQRGVITKMPFQNPTWKLFLTISKKFGVGINHLLETDISNAKENVFSPSVNNTPNAKANAKEYAKGNANFDQNQSNLTVVRDAGEKYVVGRVPLVVTVDNSGNENVVMVPVRARAGYLSGYGDQEYIQHLPSYRLPGLNNGSYRMFEVDGLSMHPTFEDKDILIAKFVENLNEIKDDRVYVVITKSDGIVIKRVLNRLQTDNKLILKSDTVKNKSEYPNLVVDPEDVLEVWSGLFLLTRHMRQPGELYTRQIDLEARMALIEHELKKKGS